MPVTLVWLRDDLRLADNPALHAAAAGGGTVVVCYVLDEVSEGIRPLGSAARWWLHGSLAALDESLRRAGTGLVLRRGPGARVIADLVRETGADTVLWNRRYGLAERTVDAAVKTWAAANDVTAQSFQANLLFEPWEVTTGTGRPYQVYTPYWRACMDRTAPRLPLPAPEALSGVRPAAEALEDWDLLPRPDWAAGLRKQWSPGEAGATERLAEFVDHTVPDYARDHELPAVEGSSRLSPHLRFGEISPFQVWDRLRPRLTGKYGADAQVFAAEIGWREFCWHLLFHNPDLATANYRKDFDSFEWEEPQAGQLQAWYSGNTGFPLVDAGMRQLWETGWMHNRIRMVTASFLTKNLMVDWRVGEQWFWDTLVDADAANNPANWQWVAGSGADASPFFRIFNPVLQSRKFDGDGTYIRRYVPQLREAANIHEPWKAPVEGYPEPLVDLAETRGRALAAYEALRQT